MTAFPTNWLEAARIWVQIGWFCLFGLALFLSVGAFVRPRSRRYHGFARWLWVAAMGAFVLMWVAGAVLEMMRRAALVSGSDLVLALGAFSILLAGVVSLVREWFGPSGREPLQCDRLALSLLILTVAGWWFGGAALEGNALWNFVPLDGGRVRAPDGWALAISGATLLGLAALVQSRDEEVQRVRNPRVATLWTVGVAFALAVPLGGHNAAAAAVFLVGAGVFLCKIWRARRYTAQRDCPVVLRVNAPTRGVLIGILAALPLIFRPEALALWLARIAWGWKSPVYVAALTFLLLIASFLLFLVREPLRLAVFHQFSHRALLLGTLAGTGAAILFFGPGGAPFFAFWPLTGLFFDLLAPREPIRPTTALLPTEAAPAALTP